MLAAGRREERKDSVWLRGKGKDENAMLKAQVSAQSDQMDFYEDCIAEMAAVVYA